MDLQKTKDESSTGNPDSTPQRLSRSPKPKRREPLRPMEGIDLDTSSSEYQQLLEMYDQSLRTLAEGEVVRGRVLRVGGHTVVVDVGYKSEGIIDLDEFAGPDGKPWLDALVLDRDEAATVNIPPKGPGTTNTPGAAVPEVPKMRAS